MRDLKPSTDICNTTQQTLTTKISWESFPRLENLTLFLNLNIKKILQNILHLEINFKGSIELNEMKSTLGIVSKHS